jgi:hypothetical protein
MMTTPFRLVEHFYALKSTPAEADLLLTLTSNINITPSHEYEIHPQADIVGAFRYSS